MSIPTIALANIRAVKSWTEKPFTEFNDTATTIYYFECVCLSSVYESNKLAKGAKLSSAANAGLIATQYIDASARWIGDSNFSYSDGGYIRFLRRFSRVPKTHEDYSSTVVTYPPVFGKTRERRETRTTQPGTTTSPAGPDIITVSYGPYEEYTRTPSKSIAVTSKLVFHYSTNPEALPVSTARSFSITQINGFSTVTLLGSINVLESTKITRWNGDIFQAVTAFAL